MNEELVKLIKDLFSEAGTNKVTFWTLTLILIVNIGVVIINCLAQFRLKTKEKSILKYGKIQDRSLQICVELYHKLEQISLMTETVNAEELARKVNEINAFIQHYKLFISDELRKCSQDITDYYMNIQTVPSLKDWGKEQKLFDQFSKTFNK